MRETLALVMFCALITLFYAIIAGVLWGASPYGLHPVIAGALASFAALAGYVAAAILEKLE